MQPNILGAIRRTWFAARKLRLPIPNDALVLEVGSGDSPVPRSDVLLDVTLENHERVGGRTVVDRPMVLGTVECLPFRDKAFDYVIAFHVLEHSNNPRAFLSELERVASAGYIETPSFWAERIQPLSMHRLEVGLEPRGDRSRLVIHQKAASVPDPELAKQFGAALEKKAGFDRLAPSAWVTRYFWKERIDYRITNPEVQISWQPPPEVTRSDSNDPRSRIRKVLKWAAQQRVRRRTVEILPLLRCVDCGHDQIRGELRAGPLWCPNCQRRFPVTAGIPAMHPVG